jgi:hypothetical protein
VVDADTEQQLEELRRERQAHARRLAVLREQRATFGPRSVPAHIVTDIDDTNSSIAQIDEQIGKLLGRALRIEQQEKLVASVDPEQALRQLLAFVYTKWEAQDAHAAELARRDERRRVARQHLVDFFYIAVFVMLAAILIRVWMS